jgi:hypothetical protein
MSEAAPESTGPTAVPARETGGQNVLMRKVGPLPTWAWLGIIGIGGAAVWYFYKSRQASAAAAQTGTTTAGSAGNCTDTNGDTVPCDQVDYGGQIATLQTEIQNLQGEAATPGPAGPAGPVGPAGAAGAGAGTTPSGGGSPGGGTPAPKPGVPGPVAGLRASKVTRTSVTLSWSKTPGATAYYVQLTYQSKTIASRTVATTSTIFTGIRPDSSMHGHVSAKNASGQGPTAEVAFHTPR